MYLVNGLETSLDGCRKIKKEKSVTQHILKPTQLKAHLLDEPTNNINHKRTTQK